MPLITPTDDLIDELESVNESFERSTPIKILEWTFDRFNDFAPTLKSSSWTREDTSLKRSNSRRESSANGRST